MTSGARFLRSSSGQVRSAAPAPLSAMAALARRARLAAGLSAGVAVAAALPALAGVAALNARCSSPASRPMPPGPGCTWYLRHPVAALNAVFLVNAVLGFWLLGLLQRSTWVRRLAGPKHPGLGSRPAPGVPHRLMCASAMSRRCVRGPQLIDLYWTIIPPLVCSFYAAHPAASSDRLRATACVALVAVWGTRLTHSYLRR